MQGSLSDHAKQHQPEDFFEHEVVESIIHSSEKVEWQLFSGCVVAGPAVY